jgi:DNA replication protein DnaC
MPAARKLCRPARARRCTRRSGPSVASAREGSSLPKGASGNRPSRSQNDVHYVIASPGVGKTFLAKIVAWRACQANQRVLFTTAMDMLNHLLASQVDHSLVRKLKTYTEPTLLVCDEIGYLALDQQTSNLFYQVISTRHSQKRSTIITTNTAFSDWGNILFNTTIATAIADRLVENSEIFLLGGPSRRKPEHNGEPS